MSFCYIIPHNNSNNYQEVFNAGADPGFQVRGAHLKKLRRAKGGAKILGVFRVKNHDFTPKKSYFSNFRGAHVPGVPPTPLDPPLPVIILY